MFTLRKNESNWIRLERTYRHTNASPFGARIAFVNVKLLLSGSIWMFFKLKRKTMSRSQL